MAAITLVGLSANYPNPGVFEEIDFAQGPVSGSGSPRTALIMGNKTTAGTATNDTQIYGPDTAVAAETEADVITLFGAGSQVHRAFLRFTAVNKSTSLYMLAVSPSAGAAAATTLTFVGTATSNGNARVWVGDQFVDTGITNGDAPATIAANVTNNINSQTRWAVSASFSAGVVTITAKNLGTEGNWTKVQVAINQGSSTITTTVTPTAITNLTGGTTADVNTTALSTILSAKYYYIISCDSDATNVGRIVTQVNTQAGALTGIRQRVFFGSTDTIANTITVATGLNATRAECIWGSATDLTPLELAANNAAIYSLLENQGTRPRNNYSLFPSSATDQTSWQILGTRNGPTSGPTPAQISSALNNGITPIALLPSGKAQLIKRVTTRSLNGSTPDYRIRDAHKVTICDFFGDDVQALTQLQFGGKDLMNDPAQGSPPPPNQVVTPLLWSNAIKGLLDVYGNNGLLQNVAAIKSGMIVQREGSPTTRMSALIGLQPVDIADQFAILIQQVA